VLQGKETESNKTSPINATDKKVLRDGNTLQIISTKDGSTRINAALFSTFFTTLLLVLTYCSRWRPYFELGMKKPGPPALPITGNCLQFTANNLCKRFQKM
jgi:hypothetical protein